VYQDTGIVAASATRTKSMAFPINNRDEHVQVRVRHNGLWSAYASHLVSVSYEPPAVPTLAISTNSTVGGIVLTFTNPTPSAGQPTVAGNEVHVRVASGGRQDLERTVNDDGIRIAVDIANNGTFTDHAAASGVDYEYRARAIGSNGTRTFGTWT